MYFIRMFTINIQNKRRVGKTKGCLINIFPRQVTDKESSYESLNSSFLVLGTIFRVCLRICDYFFYDLYVNICDWICSASRIHSAITHTTTV
jgi:hypothetical protein